MRSLILFLTAVFPMTIAHAVFPVGAWKSQKHCPATRMIFQFTGADQTFIVPKGCSVMAFKLWGGAGGSHALVRGGAGAHIYGTVTVTGGETLTIKVGGMGSQTPISSNAGMAGAGGGRTELKRSATTLVVAGGGGGAGGCNNSCPVSSTAGGDGGANNGLSGGTLSDSSATGGAGGTGVAGGAKGTGAVSSSGTNGAAFSGGTGAGTCDPTPGGWPNGGGACGQGGSMWGAGGGGDGYYGGGGGAVGYIGSGVGSGGGGGSSYTSGAGVTATALAGSGSAIVSDTDVLGLIANLRDGLAVMYFGTAITSVSPAWGPSAGGTALTINGYGFAAGAQVKIGGNLCTGVTVVNANQITCTSPAGTLGSQGVVVNIAGQMAGGMDAGFTYHNACSANTQVFSFTGANQTYTVPAGCFAVRAKLWGAGGGGCPVAGGSGGGGGGYAEGVIKVNPGDSLTVIVGGGGALPIGATGSAGGWGGGGAGGTGSIRGGAGGGGRSGVQKSSVEMITAGAGGGADGDNGGTQFFAGAGGGLIGGSGANMKTGIAKGGTQSAGGAGAAPQIGGGSSGTNGSAFQGGASSSNAGSSSGGGGGGGGYYGGGGGAADGQCAGGGGSSFIEKVASGKTIAGYQGSAANTGDANYGGGAGAGGAAGSAGANGRVVMIVGP